MMRNGTVAEKVNSVTDGLLHWTVQDQMIDFRGDAYAVMDPAGPVLVDPVQLSSDLLHTIGQPVAACITSGDHQRSVWTFRNMFGLKVWAPLGVTDLDEEADHYYETGDILPAGLMPVRADACGPVHFVLVLERAPEGPVLFCGDLVIRDDDGPFFLMPDYYVQDPEAVRSSVKALIRIEPEIICPAHGPPLNGGGKRALEDALNRAVGR